MRLCVPLRAGWQSKLDKGLKGFLKKNILKKDLKDELAVAEAKIGGVIKEKMGIPAELSAIAKERVAAGS